MWQRVIAADPIAVEAAYQVLSAYGHAWQSAAALRHWLTLADDNVYLLTTPTFSLVLGFRMDGGRQLRGTIAGMSGELSLAAIHQLVDRAVAYAEQRNATSLIFQVTDLPPTDLFATVYQLAIGVAQSNPAVASISEEDLGIKREITVQFRDIAA